jgi:hypothetical protein
MRTRQTTGTVSTPQQENDMGLFHPDDPISMPRTGGPKWSSSIADEFKDTIEPETWRKHDAQAAYDPDAMPAQYVRNPCEGDDDEPPPSLAMVLVYGISALVAVGCVAFLVGWLA